MFHGLITFLGEARRDPRGASLSLGSQQFLGTDVRGPLGSAPRPRQADGVGAWWWERRQPPPSPSGGSVRCRVGASALRKAMGAGALYDGAVSPPEVCSLSSGREEKEKLVLVRKASAGSGGQEPGLWNSHSWNLGRRPTELSGSPACATLNSPFS